MCTNYVCRIQTTENVCNLSFWMRKKNSIGKLRYKLVWSELRVRSLSLSHKYIKTRLILCVGCRHGITSKTEKINAEQMANMHKCFRFLSFFSFSIPWYYISLDEWNTHTAVNYESHVNCVQLWAHISKNIIAYIGGALELRFNSLSRHFVQDRFVAINDNLKWLVFVCE